MVREVLRIAVPLLPVLLTSVQLLIYRIICSRISPRFFPSHLRLPPMGKRRVTQYIMDLHSLTADRKWNMMDYVATRVAQKNLEELEVLASRIDLRLPKRRSE
ncbi:hypothetical protein ILYODFUR_005486 [Ilyodon furcidens]|uniref:Uncharacterized protein n=1 Tax=Ilyodon furcidens TaxID=33524 RepID=A0ABV0V359_9TELE